MILRVLHNQCYPTRLKHSSIFTNTLQANKPAREKMSWYLHVVASGWERQHQGRLWQGDIGWGKKWRIATRWMQDASPRHWPSLPRGRKSAHTGGWPSSLFVVVMHVCGDPLPVRILVLVRPEPEPEPADKLGTVRRFEYSGMEAAAGSAQGAVSMVTSSACGCSRWL